MKFLSVQIFIFQWFQTTKLEAQRYTKNISQMQKHRGTSKFSIYTKTDRKNCEYFYCFKSIWLKLTQGNSCFFQNIQTAFIHISSFSDALAEERYSLYWINDIWKAACECAAFHLKHKTMARVSSTTACNTYKRDGKSGNRGPFGRNVWPSRRLRRPC